MEKPAILNGKKEFEDFLPIISPSLPPLSSIVDQVDEILNTGMITNFSKYVRTFEDKCAEYLGSNYALSQSNATTGLMLAFQALGLTGEVIVPSFTFSATVHTLLWNNLTPVFVDIDPETYNIDPKLIENKISDKTSAILGVNIFGNPCDIDELERIAQKYKLKLVFDSAHAFGSKYKGKRLGVFGDAEIFSMSATKLLVTAEGGLITTKDKTLYDRLKLARNYGDPGDYNCQFVGFNSKMTEFSAILGLESLKTINDQIKRRNDLRNSFIEKLRKIPGLHFQKIKKGNVTSVKDFSILVDEKDFGINRDALVECLAHENIHSKKYFYPPIHLMNAYCDFRERYRDELPQTEFISKNIVCLPIHSKMQEATVHKICHAIEKIQFYSKEIIRRKK
jgi:dTDP-4-amino-4,6-dideoxygalactose transaminase